MSHQTLYEFVARHSTELLAGTLTLALQPSALAVFDNSQAQAADPTLNRLKIMLSSLPHVKIASEAKLGESAVRLSLFPSLTSLELRQVDLALVAGLAPLRKRLQVPCLLRVSLLLFFVPVLSETRRARVSPQEPFRPVEQMLRQQSRSRDNVGTEVCEPERQRAGHHERTPQVAFEGKASMCRERTVGLARLKCWT